MNTTAKTAITSLMALMVSLTITLAGTGNGFGNGGIPQGGTTGNGTLVAHYTATYTDYFFGPVSCTGVHQTGKNFGKWGQDSFTCTATPAGAVLTNVFPNETLSLSNIGGWYSDYLLLTAGQSPLASAFNAVVSSDGTHYTAVANY
jgi:hypothetical protein